MGFVLSDMKLSSSAFKHGGSIPKRHTGEGADISPAMSWSGAPEGTGSFALICHDPDAPLVSPGNNGFGGPMPPEGHGTHHYFFWLLALDSGPELAPGLSMWELLEKIEPNVIAMNRLVGTYER